LILPRNGERSMWAQMTSRPECHLEVSPEALIDRNEGSEQAEVVWPFKGEAEGRGDAKDCQCSSNL